MGVRLRAALMMTSPQVRLLLGSILISFSSIFAKLASVPPTVSAFYRVAIGGVVLTGFVAVKRWPLTYRPARWMMITAAAALFALDLGFWHRSIAFIGPGLSTLLASFQVFVMAGAGVLFFSQKLEKRQMIAIPMAIVGLALVAGVGWSGQTAEYQWGIVLGLLTALSYATYLLTLRQTQAGGDGRLPVKELAAISLGSAGLLGVASIFSGDSFAIPSALDLCWLILYGLVCHVCGWLLIASSLPRLSTAVAGLTLTLQPLLTMVWDVLFFGRGLTPIEATGSMVTLAAIYLGSRRR